MVTQCVTAGSRAGLGWDRAGAGFSVTVPPRQSVRQHESNYRLETTDELYSEDIDRTVEHSDQTLITMNFKVGLLLLVVRTITGM